VNINTEMNYWPVASGDLIECEEPLIDLVRELATSGEEVASRMYHRSGWVAHHNTTIWRSAQPVDNVAQTSFWPMAGGWLSRHLWDHYLFTCDCDYLVETAIPLMVGASKFYLEWLVEEASGYLTTPVGTSPENAFVYHDSDGNECTASVSSGPTMDIAIIRDCLENTRLALETAGVEPELSSKLDEAIGRLLPYSIADDGQLEEWSHEHSSHETRHRHISHLYGAFPAYQLVTPDRPELAAAVEKTLDVRGEESGGWSSAWKANIWARLGKAERAYRNLKRLASQELTNPNLFNGHRIWTGGEGLFQIDGNMGGAAAIIEMLVQSRYAPGEAAEVAILPALPAAWPVGEVRGIRCRGGFSLSVSWRDMRLEGLEITSHRGNSIELAYGGRTCELHPERGETVRLDADLRPA
jgi:alpha-L-fucosidase 2